MDISKEKDILIENEKKANIVTAISMLYLYLLILIIGFLALFKIIDAISKNEALIILVSGIMTLVIPAIICLIIKGKGKWLKYFLVISMIITISAVDMIVEYYSLVLLLSLPIILSARYYSKKFTIFTVILTMLIYILAQYLNIVIWHYINYDWYFETLPYEEAVDMNRIDWNVVNEEILIISTLPKFFMYLAVSFGCIQISKAGIIMLKKQKKLSEETARVESELAIAKSIQSNMLETEFPAFPNHEEFDIHASMIPAKEVGGDFYDMFLIDDSHLAFGIADVSGKGVPGALIMMNAKVLIQSTALSGKSIDDVFNIVNNELCKKNKLNHFITSWFGIIDLVNGKLEYVNAGHNPPLIYKKSEDRFECLKTKHNLTLAAMENIKYTKHELILSPGDKLFLYTDGVTEATNENNELYSEARLQSYLNKNITNDLNQAINGVKNDIDKFVGNREQFDDITMLEFSLKDYLKGGESKKFKADTKELRNVISYLDDCLSKNGISQKIINQLELVIEELFVNVCNYAYEDKNGYFKMTFNMSDNKIKIILEDGGINFNPLEREEPDISLSTEDREIGGLGILLVKKNLDNIKYKREDNKNILILEKSIKEDK